MSAKRILQRELICCSFFLAFVVFVGLFTYRYYDTGFYVASIEYHGEVLAVGYCTASNSLMNLSNIMYRMNETLRVSPMANNILDAIIDSVEKVFPKGACQFTSVAYAPALENATYEKLEQHGGVIYVYFKRHNGNYNDRDFLFVRFTNNKLNIRMILFAIPITMLLRRFMDSVVEGAREPQREHYLLLVGVSYLSLSLFIHFMAWVGAAFQNTALVALVRVVSIALLTVLGVPAILVSIEDALLWIARRLKRSPLRNCRESCLAGSSGMVVSRLIAYKMYLYYLVFVVFFFILIMVVIIGQNMVPTGLYGISDSVAIGVSIVYMVLLTLLSLSRMSAVSAAYQVTLMIVAIILSVELLLIFVLYNLVMPVGMWLALFLGVMIYMLCISMPRGRGANYESGRQRQCLCHI